MDPFGAAGGVRFEIETDRCAWAGPCRSWLPGVRDQPGLGTVLGARILGEFGDEPHRYTDAKAGRDCAGTSRSPARPAAEEVVLLDTPRSRRLAYAGAISATWLFAGSGVGVGTWEGPNVGSDEFAVVDRCAAGAMVGLAASGYRVREYAYLPKSSCTAVRRRYRNVRHSSPVHRTGP